MDVKLLTCKLLEAITDSDDKAKNLETPTKKEKIFGYENLKLNTHMVLTTNFITKIPLPLLFFDK